MVPGDRLLATKDHAGLCRGLSQVVRQHLIHADAAFEFRTFLQRSTGEDIARLARMNADAGRVLVKEAMN